MIDSSERLTRKRQEYWAMDKNWACPLGCTENKETIYISHILSHIELYYKIFIVKNLVLLNSLPMEILLNSLPMEIFCHGKLPKLWYKVLNVMQWS